MDLGHPGWNDIVADGRGNIYVNGAGFNPAAGQESRPGAVYHVAADGPVRQVAGDIAFPNGMTVIADNSTLIVADSYRHHLVAFDIGADGGLSGRRVWADLGEGTPDGICADSQDTVWYADVPAGGACASPREAPCWTPLNWTAAASPASWAARGGRRCSSRQPSGGA